MRPVVDEGLCIGCGNCEQICPSVFHVIDDISKVVDPEGCDMQDCCEAAEENCPVEAITLED
jgi:ferredoxin